jgi:hypothetical protein
MATVESRENRAFAYEIKFVLPASEARELRVWARERMRPDPNTESGIGDTYRISSLYFDTSEWDVFQRRGSYGRCKYRVRRYDASEMVFLERKLRKEHAVTKRRTLVQVEELRRLRQEPAGSTEPEKWAGRWFERRIETRGMAPVCQISYVRTALVSENESGLVRLTLDEDLRAWPVREAEFHALSGGTSLVQDHMIVEMKFRLGMPALFTEALEKFRIESQPISKYRLAVTGLGFAPATAPLEILMLETGSASPASANI